MASKHAMYAVQVIADPPGPSGRGPLPSMRTLLWCPPRARTDLSGRYQALGRPGEAEVGGH